MSRTIGWWYQKANALAEAVPGHAPTTYAKLLGVATHETNAGDAWPGEHNWGATTRRPLRADEKARLDAAGIRPLMSPAAARIANEAAANKLLGFDRPDSDVAVHTDSRPLAAGGQLVYMTCFAKFPSDVEGARYFANFFHTAAEVEALESGSIDSLARAMYQARYYTGFSTDPVINIAAYANACRPLVAECRAALDMWYPGAEPPVYSEPADPSRATVREVQALLNEKGAAITVDGVFGPATRAAVLAFQKTHLPAVAGQPGYADPATVLALRA